MDGIRTFETADGKTVKFRVRPKAERGPRTGPSPNAKLVLDKLHHWASKDGKCYCESKHENIAKYTCRSERSVARAVAELVRIGFLVVRSRGQGKLSEYRLSETGLAFMADVEEKRRLKKEAKSKTASKAPPPALASLESPALASLESPALASLESPTLASLESPTGGGSLQKAEMSSSKQEDFPDAAAQAALEKAGRKDLSENREVVQSLAALGRRRSVADAMLVVKWLAVDLRLKGKRVTNPAGYARKLFIDPLAYFFREDGERLVMPNDAAAKALEAEERRARIRERERRDAEASKRRSESEMDFEDLRRRWWQALPKARQDEAIAAAVDQWPMWKDNPSYIASKAHAYAERMRDTWADRAFHGNAGEFIPKPPSRDEFFKQIEDAEFCRMQCDFTNAGGNHVHDRTESADARAEGGDRRSGEGPGGPCRNGD